MRAHIYTRVSTDEQALEGFSLQAQERVCRLYCEGQNVPLEGVYCDEGHSGVSANRPEFKRMLAQVQPGDLVLVHKLDRFTRNVRLLLETLDDFAARNIRLVSVSEQIDFSSPIGKVILTILAAFAQYYIDNLRQETRKGNLEKAQRGHWVGPVPVGYRKVDKGTIVPSKDADIIKEVFRLYHTGMGYYRIADELNRRGHRGPAGAGWVRESVRTVLRNRAYIGKVSSGGVEFDGNHEPLISVELWEATAARRAASTRIPLPNREHLQPGPIAGLLHCASCGRRLWFKYGRAEERTRSFYCRGQSQKTCTAPHFQASTIEQAVQEITDLVAAGDAAQFAEAIYVLKGEIVRVAPTARYRRLLERLGIPVGE